MKTIKTTCGNEIKIFSSAKEMSVLRYSQFQKYLFSDVNISSLKSCIEKAKAQLFDGEKDNCNIELDNAFFCIDSLSSGVNFGGLAFACLVGEVNKKPVNDLSEDGLQEIIDIISAFEITQQDIDEASEYVKKKISKEIETLFPDFQDKSSRVLYFTKLKNYISFSSSIFEEGEPSEDDLHEYRKQKNWFLTKEGCKKMSESMSEIEKGFLSILSVLEIDMQCNILQFYAKIEYLNKKNLTSEN